MPSTASSSSSRSSHITLLGYLQDYADISEKSHKEMKTSYWHLTKSRRNASSGILGVDSTTAFTAQLLREELISRVRLVDDNNKAAEEEEINLVDEDESILRPIKIDPSKSSCSSSSPNSPKWNLYDVLLKKAKEKDNTETLASVSSVHDDNDPTLNTGLRQRKTRNMSSTKIKSATNEGKEQAQKEEGNEATTSSCTILHEEDLDSNSDIYDDDEKLLGKDPIEFFYGHNRELKIAQRNAQNALNSYIQAANQAVVILTFLRESKK